MLKHLRRWHFDVALFLGLALFSWAYWYSKTRPLWQMPFPQDNPALLPNVSMLGFSEDDARFFTCTDTTTQPRHLPQPQIQCWQTRTGKLIKSYPLQVPEEDRQLLKPMDQYMMVHTFRVNRTINPRYIMVRLEQTTPGHYRLYDVEDGRCVSKAFGYRAENDSLTYLVQHPDRDHPLALRRRRSEQQSPEIIDMVTGEQLHAFHFDALDVKSLFFSATVTPDGQFLLLTSYSQAKETSALEVYRIKTWEKVAGLKLTEGTYPQTLAVDNNHWIVKSLISLDSKNYDRNRLDCIRFDPSEMTLTMETAHPLHGRVYSNSENPVLYPHALVTYTYDDNYDYRGAVLQQIESWLNRVGIHVKRSRTQNYHLFDLRTAQPLRQLSGIEVGEFQYQLSRHNEYLAVACYKRNDLSVSVYQVPVWWWEPMLSWMQWLSWLLVIPWPLRYFVPIERQAK